MHMYELRESSSIFVKHRDKVSHDIVSLECILCRVSIEVVSEIIHKPFGLVLRIVYMVLETEMGVQFVQI